MPKLEKSYGVQLELKDLDTSKRTAVIKHSVYTSIDRVQDISTKGMFTKSWQEGLPKFYLNHDTTLRPGKTLRVFEDNEGGYTEVKFANTTLGNDTMEMADEGLLEGASFGYITEKKEYVQIKGQKVRKLTEVKHIETSLLTVPPAHPEAGIITLNKAFEDLEDNDIESLLQWHDEQLMQLKSYVEKIDAYCRKANASDLTIQLFLRQANEYKNLISQYDTAITQVATEPDASDEEVKGILNNFITTLNIQTWQKKQFKSN
jgi:HK97 family phage prohead protease